MSSESDATIDVLRERNTLSQALLDATAALAYGREPEAILRTVCDALVKSTSHIRLAWMMLGNLDAEVLRPDYAVGPGKPYGEHLKIDSGPTMSVCPTRRAISSWEPALGEITTDPGCASVRDAAIEQGLHSVICLPVGRKESPRNGLISIYSDRAEYFDTIGLEPFNALIHVVNASLEQAALVSSLSHLVNHDQLTDILNRRGLEEFMVREHARSRRHDKPFTIILFDIDRFKLINDRLGHHQGDEVLMEVTRIAQTLLRTEDCLGRWGGEEFLCMLPETGREQALTIAERMRQRIEQTDIETGHAPLNVTASFGFACFPDDGQDLDKLIAAADAALYQAKQSGRNRTVGAYSLEQHVYSVGSMLDAALRDNRIVPAYQPIVDLNSGEIVAEEALARMIMPDGEIMEAGLFIQVANQLQFLHRIDSAVIMHAFRHCVADLQNGRRLDHFINVSADLLRHQDLVEQLLSEAREYCSECAGVIGEVKPMVIEITERELVSDIDTARELLTPFTDFGLRLALDDFGSGYSSYRYLADLPVSFIKIEGQLVRRVHEPKVRAIVQGIQNTALELGITTTAEFVEDAQTEALLKEIGVHRAQGYYYGKPQIPGRDTVGREISGRVFTRD